MTATTFLHGVLQRLNEIRKDDSVNLFLPNDVLNAHRGPIDLLEHICIALEGQGRISEGSYLRHVIDIALADRELGGLGFANDTWETLDETALREVEFLIDAWLTAAESRTRRLPPALHHKDQQRLPMNLTEKILAHHAFSVPHRTGVSAGDLLHVSIDWVMASELTWVGMKHSMASVNMKSSAWRNDRFWLAGDHTVDPRTYHEERTRSLIEGLENAKRDLKMTENQGANYTIMHTEFVRERAQPGMLVLGADSHTCSAGAVGTLAIGLGAGDVMIGLATGETWFKVPESIRINFVGELAWYIRGKDVILDILGKLKRNTYAADRVVEFGGPGAKFLTCDDRFAISNMCTELGAITGIFVPDEVTHSFVNSRKRKMYKSDSLYFTPDAEATYANTFEIDLGKVRSFIAIYPSPDQVCPVTERVCMQFDGCFIGACTTTEEDLILAALVLEAGLKRGWRLNKGKRIVVPGSLPILRNLRALGLLDIYKECGYEQPAPGCSMCVGVGADSAEAGSRWLSSQNRNFRNRMGKGAIGHICSSATVAASSFSMILTDPKELLEDVSEARFNECLEQCRSWKRGNVAKTKTPAKDRGHGIMQYVEPCLLHQEIAPSTNIENARPSVAKDELEANFESIISSHIYRLGDYVDTDMIIPAPACVGSPTDEMLGSHCLEITNPDFRESARVLQKVIVAGRAFGCGSSREEAPRALKGLGVQCVIAKSFAFIFGRNMPNVGMLAIVITDEAFYEVAQHGVRIDINLKESVIRIAENSFRFVLDDLELELIRNRGLASSYQQLGNQVFASLCNKNSQPSLSTMADIKLERKEQSMDW